MPISERAARLHRESIIIDPCVQYLLRRTDRTDRSGLTAVGLTIPMPNEDAAQTFPRVQAFLEVIHDEPTFCLADSPAAIRRAKAEGKLAHILLSQDAHFVGADPASLLVWKQLGLRICQLTYNEQNLLGSGCLERHDAGLSQLGRVMVREMERYGITIDLTHAGRRTFMDICAVATRRSSRRTRTRGRSPTTRATSTTTRSAPSPPRAGWSASPPGRRSSGTARRACRRWPDWLRCVDHAVNLVGIDHVGVSTDSMGTMGAYPRHARDPDALPYGSVTDRFDRLAQPARHQQPPAGGFQRHPGLPGPGRGAAAPTASATTTSASCWAATCCGCSTPPGSPAGSDERPDAPNAADEWSPERAFRPDRGRPGCPTGRISCYYHAL